jgi:RNA polymerase sigma factor (sigma-70 family)
LSEANLYKEPNKVLIERCRKGETAAFRELYDLYCRGMFSVCVRLLNNKEEAEDVLQEAFISAFKNIGQYSFNASFGSWLKKIVVNKSLDVLNKRKFNFVSIDDVDVSDDQPEEEENYTIDEIRQAVQALPDGYRVILTLFLFEGYSHKAIAGQLNISEGTSKSQYHRARKKLQELIITKKMSYEQR